MKLHQDGNRIVVTELNQMSEAPMGKSILIKSKFDHQFFPSVLDGGENTDTCDGWLPFPVYEPQED